MNPLPKAAPASEIRHILRKLAIDDPRFVEIESKRRVLPADVPALKKNLLKRPGVRPVKTAMFFDQYLDTAALDILRSGASLRIRYKGDGSRVYLQYKGPGFSKDGILYRSEYSSGVLTNVLREESHHDVVHFAETTVRDILGTQVTPAMSDVIRRHLGHEVIARVSQGPVICMYRKEKFAVDLGPAFLEPSVDQVFAFLINASGLHTLSTFCEYENEIKSAEENLSSKLGNLDSLLEFDRSLAGDFAMPVEPFDKYRRCASCFLNPLTGDKSD